MPSGSHSFEVRAIDAAGNVDATPASRAWSVDASAPDTSISAGPSGTTTATSASLSFASSESGSTFECRLDGSAWGACSSPKAYTGLASGSHSFEVRAIDAAGNVDATPGLAGLECGCVGAGHVDFGGSVGSRRRRLRRAVSFASSESGSTFECRLDGSAWGACSSPKAYTGLATGAHTFEVRAIDAAGNVDATPASRAWTVGTDPGGTDRYLSPTGSDAAACTQAAPCRTIARGYQVAQPGQTVVMAAGSYADASVPPDASKTSPTDVIVRPAAGAGVSLSSEIHVTAKHLELRGLAFQRRLWVDGAAEDLTVRDADLATFTVMSSGAQSPKDISFIGGETGPSLDANNIIASNGNSTTASPRNVVIDGMTFHDFTLSAGSSSHVECLQVWAADGLTIRNSRFRNCEVFDIFLQKLPGGSAATPSNILIENNFMDCCGDGFYAIRMGNHAGTAWSNVTIRNNSFNKAINPDPDVSFSNVKIVGNIGPKIDFYSQNTDSVKPQPAGVTTDYNVWYAGAKVGTHDKVAPSGFIDPAAFNFHIGPLSAAVNAADPANAPAADIDGEARPSGTAPDAGADEVTGSAASASARRHHTARHLPRLGSLGHDQLHIGQLRVQLIRERLDVRLPSGRGRLGLVQLAQGLHEPGGRLPYLQRARH